MRTCSVKECQQEHMARGLCDTHYRRYRYQTIPEVRKQQLVAQLSRRKRDVRFRLAKNLRQRLWQAIKGKYKAGSAVTDLGCSIGQFKLYIENQFSKDMSWDNYGDWHLDHIMPLASFDLTDRGEFQTAAYYTNFQPLWANDNLRKGSRV